MKKTIRKIFFLIRDTITVRPLRKALQKKIKKKLRETSKQEVRRSEIITQIEADFKFDDKTFLIFQHQFFDRTAQSCYNGGAERYVRDLSDILTNMGFKAVLVQMGNDKLWQRQVGNMQVIGIPSTDCEDYQQIIGSFTQFGGVIYSGAVFWGEKLLHPNIMISHGVTWDTLNQDVGLEHVLKIFTDVDHFVSVDTNTISWLRTTFAKTLRPKQMNYIPNYVDCETYKPALKKDNQIKICFPRRASPERGYWLMSESLPPIMEKYPDVTFDFVGFAHGTKITDDIRKLAAAFPNRVNHYVVEPEEMIEVYQKSDISLIPTLYAEGTSLSCLEAQACGNVVITTNIGGLPNLVIDGYNGLLINPDGKELLAALDKVLASKELRQHLSQNAISVAQAFDKKIWASRWQNIIAKAANLATNTEYNHAVAIEQSSSGATSSQAAPASNQQNYSYRNRKNPLVSIIIPTYNNEKFIRSSIASVVNQTYKNLEIIIINDATPDNSMQIVEEFAKNDKRIKIITHEKNEGIGASKNDGLAAATGEFLAFFSTDDTLDAAYIENMLNCHYKTGSDIICGNLLMNNEHYNIWEKSLTFHTYSDKLSAKAGSCGFYSAKLIRDNQISFPIANLGEDTAFTMIACYFANHVSTCPEAFDFINRVGHKSETCVSVEYMAQCRERAIAYANDFVGGKLPEFVENSFAGVRRVSMRQ